MNDKFGKKDKTTLIILWTGLFILAVCLSVCLFLVAGLKKEYSERTSENFHSHHLSATHMINSKFEDVGSCAVSFATRIGGDSEFPSNTAIFNTIKVLEKFDDITYAYYISENNQVYHDGKTFATTQLNGDFAWSDLDSKFNKSVDTITMFIEKADFGLGEGEKIYLIAEAPVYYYSAYRGMAITVKDITTFFDDEAFIYQNGIGSCYIIDKEGAIYLDSLPEGAESSDNLFDYLASYSNNRNKSKSELLLFKNIVARNENGHVSVVTKDGYSCQISTAPIDIKGLYFVSCFDDNIVDDEIHPLVIRSVLACIVILSLMICIIFYIWYSGKKTNITIERLAYIDFVTDGKNVNYFKEFAQHSIVEYKEMPFLIYRFDIVNFRYINESYGHIRADGILKMIIKSFEEIFTDMELCVRMDSDQFLAIVINDRSLDQKLLKFKEKVNQDARGLGIKYPIRFKAGVCQVRKQEHNIDILIDHANVARKTLSGDEKVYQAVYSEKIVNDMRKVDRIESDQQRALASDEFKVYLQPKWNIRDNRVSGAEALVRWIKNDGSMVYPDEFIPIFENNGFIEKLDFYMLEKVCFEMKNQIEAGIPVYPVSVNQSRMLLHNSDYVKNVEKIIKSNNIPAGFIELEITETVFETERENMIKTMNELKKIGVRLSMDDFGSGYSSLNMLKDVPFDILKIDREFFSESVTSEASLLILQKIVEMAHGLGLQVVCEGVETGEQVVLLQTIGVSYVQGYFYSKPLPSDVYYKNYCGGYNE